MKHLLLISLFASLAAQAYVPPSFFILKTMAAKHHASETATIRNKITFFNRSGEPLKSLTEELVLGDRWTAVTVITDASGVELRRNVRKFAGGKDIEAARPLTYDLLFIRDQMTIFEKFKSLGLPVKSETELYSERVVKPAEPAPQQPEEALAALADQDKAKITPPPSTAYVPEQDISIQRFDNKITVAVGLQTGKTQLWVEKDSLLPLRVTTPEQIEYRLSGYQLFKNTIYPRIMQVYKNGQLWLKVEAIEARFGVAEDNSKIARTKSEPDSDYRDNLDQFFKYVR